MNQRGRLKEGKKAQAPHWAFSDTTQQSIGAPHYSLGWNIGSHMASAGGGLVGPHCVNVVFDWSRLVID